MNSAAAFNLMLLVGAITTCTVHSIEKEADGGIVLNINMPPTTPPLSRTTKGEPTTEPPSRSFCDHVKKNYTFHHDLCEDTATTRFWGCTGVVESDTYYTTVNSVLHIVKNIRRCVPEDSTTKLRKLTFTRCKGKASAITVRHFYPRISNCREEKKQVITPLLPPTTPPPLTPTPDC